MKEERANDRRTAVRGDTALTKHLISPLRYIATTALLSVAVSVTAHAQQAQNTEKLIIVNGVAAQHVRVVNGDTVVNQGDPTLLSGIQTLLAQAQARGGLTQSTRMLVTNGDTMSTRVLVINGDTVEKIVNGDTLIADADPELKATLDGLLRLNFGLAPEAQLPGTWTDKMRKNQK